MKALKMCIFLVLIGSLDIAEADTAGIAATQAQALLNAVYGYDYRTHPKAAPSGGLGSIIAPPSNGNAMDFEASESIQLEAYPNPAKELVKFKYKSVRDQVNIWVTIHDVNGRLVTRLPIQSTENTVEWKTDGIASGVYYYKITGIDYSCQAPNKIVLIK